MPSIVIRIRQKGYIRTSGYQVVQWAVTVPVADPPIDPLIGTAPLSFAPLFIVRNNSGFDSLDRIASIKDLVDYPQSELIFFDLRGAGGDNFFAPLTPSGPLGPFLGDILAIPDTASSLSYWLEDDPPYNTNTFLVKQSVFREQGDTPQVLLGNRLQLPGYTFTSDDIGRWINLSGFSTSSYNGLTQILGYIGNTATISKIIPSVETGSHWGFPYVEIETNISPSLEPRFFPTRERNLNWELHRGPFLVAHGSGGTTMRSIEQDLVRSIRFTAVTPTNQSALDLMSITRNGAMNLQIVAAENDTDFTPLITSTYGP